MATDSHNELEPLNRSHYPAQTVEIALAVLAFNGGNSVRASDQLGEAGIKIPAPTLKDWRRRFYPKRYAKACNDLAPQLEAAIVHQARESIIAAGQVEQSLLERLHDEAKHLDRKDLAGALRNVSTAKAINVDKMLTMTGRPNEIRENRTPEQSFKRLSQLVPGLIIEGTADEAPA